MAETAISAKLVKELRDQTGVGMMECKKALVEAGGDKDQAVKLLRERGQATAVKKSGRAANQGLIAAEVYDGGKAGVMVEVNCETDFVARNETFQAFVQEILHKAREIEGDLGEALKDDVVAQITEIGENIIARRHVRFAMQGAGQIASYVHLGGKVGVLLEVACGKEETVAQHDFKELVKDLTMHVAACNPDYLTRDEVPRDLLDAEKEIYAKQVENKPAQIVDKIVNGKVEKYYGQMCLVEQGFVKDPKVSVTDLLAEKGQSLGDEITIRRFARYQLGAE